MTRRQPAAPTGAPIVVHRKYRWLKWTGLALVILVVLALVPAGVAQIASIERVLTTQTVEPHDVAIVFGAGLEGDGPGPYLTARLVVARDLYFQGKARVILVSGDHTTPYHDEPGVMQTWLVSQGVPAARIVQDAAGVDTYSTCVRAREIFGVGSAILVTQSYHLPRAIATCRMTGLDAVGVGDDTVRPVYPGLWRSYQVREVAADINMLWQVATHRQPILGPTEDGVHVALGR